MHSLDRPGECKWWLVARVDWRARIHPDVLALEGGVLARHRARQAAFTNDLPFRRQLQRPTFVRAATVVVARAM